MKKYIKTVFLIAAFCLLSVVFLQNANASQVKDCKETGPWWSSLSECQSGVGCKNVKDQNGVTGTLTCSVGVKSGYTNKYGCCGWFTPCSDKSGMCSSSCSGGYTWDGNCTQDIDNGATGKCCVPPPTTSKQTTTTECQPHTCDYYGTVCNHSLDNGCGGTISCTSGCSSGTTNTTKPATSKSPVGTKSPGSGSAPPTAGSCTTRCSDTYNHTRVTFSGTGCTTKNYTLDCSCPATNGKPANQADATITNEWSCNCQTNGNSWTPITNSSGNFCCGYPQDVNPVSTTCAPQTPTRYAGVSHDSCYDFGNSTAHSNTCLPGGGSSWCCYKVDTTPYSGTFSRCSDKYKYCYSTWTTNSSGLDTPKTGYTLDCQCNDPGITGTRPECPASSCGVTTTTLPGATTTTSAGGVTTTTLPGATTTTSAGGVTTTTLPPACGTPCSNPADCSSAQGGCTTCDPATNTCVAPACGNKCNVPADCANSKDGCTTCTNNVCTAPPPACGTPCSKPADCSSAQGGCTTCDSTTNTCVAPACGNKCNIPADCASSKDGCTTCTNNICAAPFNPASCTCDGIQYTGLFSGQPVTITAFSKIVGDDVNNAKVVSEKFRLINATDPTNAQIIAESGDIASTIIQNSSASARYQTQWQLTLPQLVTGATYRISSDIDCQPKTVTFNYNRAPKTVVLAAQTNISFWDSFFRLFGDFAANVVSSLGSGNNEKKTLQLGTFKPATIIENGCNTIIFKQN